MRDSEKSGQVKRLCDAIIIAAECYENDFNPIYFDYDSVIVLLEQAQTLVAESARCPRPANLPPHIPWREKLYDSDEAFDPYAFDGTMGVEDYERMHELMDENDVLDEDDSYGMVMV
jgi:hypothetical protein